MGEQTPAGHKLSRRSLLLGLGALPLTACVATPPNPSRAESTAAATPPPVYGAVQAGIVRPSIPQAHARVAVYDAQAGDRREFLAALGTQISALVTDLRSEDADDDTSITVGISDAWAQDLWGPEGAVHPLPAFARDSILPSDSGGDLVLQICASKAWTIAQASATLTNWCADRGAVLRWAQDGARDVIPGADYARNLTGFHDGIINPRTEAEHEAGVWSSVAGTSVMVVRRLAIDLQRFLGLDPTDQEKLIGRKKGSGAPLSGGKTTDEIALFAKDNAGNYLVPTGAHAREAHPSAMGEALMLRRGYAYSRGAEQGHLFISFQSDVEIFTKTQLHLDAADGFMKHVSCTASGVFRILPGFSAEAPLGHV